MLVGADAGSVGVVIELNELFAPPEEHGLAGGKQGVDGDEQGFGPMLDGAYRGAAPVELTGETGHFASAEDEVLREGLGSGSLFAPIPVFYSHERLLQDAGFRLRRSFWAHVCTNSNQHQKLDVFPAWDGSRHGKAAWGCALCGRMRG